MLGIGLLLVAGSLLAHLGRRYGLPSVSGYLVAGLGLGAVPALFPTDGTGTASLLRLAATGYAVFVVGVAVTRARADLRVLACLVPCCLVAGAGALVLALLPRLWPEQRLVFALFMAVAMSISAVPVIAKVLMDLKLTRRDIGQLILTAAMTDDTVGWILLSVVAGLATAGTVNLLSVAQALGGAALFLLLAFTIGTRIVSRIINVTDSLFGGVNAQLSVVLVSPRFNH